MVDRHTPRIGMISLGCPKALTDSERILSRLRAEGYLIAPDYAGADAVIVNTCGFLDSAREESLQSIGEALRENGTVIVTGCLGAEPEVIRQKYPNVRAITGPHRYEEVMAAVRDAVPPPQRAHEALIPEPLIKLTPRHYAYLKIAEGCHNRCSFCIIPALRGDLVSRPVHEVLYEAERLVKAGVRELLIVSQDTGAYGLDVKYAEHTWRDRTVATRLLPLARELGSLGAWVRLHYMYPYPHLDELLPLMAEGVVLPYLDMPLQHMAPNALKAMRRPAFADKTIDRVLNMRRQVPSLTIRSTFIVGFPGETESDFQQLLDALSVLQLDRVGCFKYEAVKGAAANALPDAVPEDVKQERYDRLMRLQAGISRQRMRAKIGTQCEAIVDTVHANGRAVGRTVGDAPEIDGTIKIAASAGRRLQQGDIVRVQVTHAQTYDLSGRLIDEAA